MENLTEEGEVEIIWFGERETSVLNKIRALEVVTTTGRARDKDGISTVVVVKTCNPVFIAKSEFEFQSKFVSMKVATEPM